jgi:probable rRNA maturation factor
MRTKSTPKRRLRSSVAVQRAVRGAPAAARLRAWARAAAPPGAEVTLRVVGAAEARRLNRAFRKRDYATNVLSFSYGPKHGDLVLCHPVIAREAREWKKELSAHYAHLVVHGMLHLRGRDHARRAQARRMERAEIAVLRRLGFGDPYALK